MQGPIYIGGPHAEPLTCPFSKSCTAWRSRIQVEWHIAEPWDESFAINI